MYVPGSVPKGPHYLYIFKHGLKPWFKIGESRNPTYRRKSLGSHLRSKEYRKWKFANYYGCFYVEQVVLEMMDNYGITRVRSQDWFELDQTLMDAIVISIDNLAGQITSWEDTNVTTECDACRQDRPYGAYLSRTHWLTFEHWFETEGGRWETIDSLEERIDDELKRLKLRNRTIPESVLQIIAATFPDKLSTTKR